MLYGETKEYAFTIPNPRKRAVLRLPEPAEMLDYLRAQKSLRKDLGRGKIKSQSIPTPKADLALFEKIRLPEPEGITPAPFDEFEARAAIRRITSHEVDGSEHKGDSVIVTMRWDFWGPFSGETAHTLQIPTMEQVESFQRSMAAGVLQIANGQLEVRALPDPAVDLYDSLQPQFTGYAPDTPVPPHHKNSIVMELLQAINAMVDDPADPL